MLTWTGSCVAAPDRVSDFALLDQTGEFHQLSRYRHRTALVLMSWSDDCATMSGHVEQLSALRDQWRDRGFEFILLDTGNQDRDALRRTTTGFPILDDEVQVVARSLNISHAGEVLVLNPDRLAVYYRGPLHEQLDTALGAVAEQEGIEETVNLSLDGCPVDYSASLADSTAPDYSTEVAPIIVDKCIECHRRDGVGPFALDSHVMVMGWSPMIREVLLNKRMPPTQVDPHIGFSADARYLSEKELETLVHWIDSGAPRGEGTDDPLEREYHTDPHWSLGEPDMIVQGPANEVPPTGVMDYIYVNVELPFDTGKWVRAVQYKAGDESVLHHLMTYVTAPGEDFFGPERNETSVTRRFLSGYAPGDITALEFPQGTGVLIPAGHRLSMQFHYVTNGRATVDETQLGLYFYDQPPGKEYLTQAVSERFVIAPGDPDHHIEAEHTFDGDVVITGLRAHMHFRGKRMKFSMEREDGSWQDLLSIPAYNYGWQPQYQLHTPVRVPAGTRIRVNGAFDNSESNPNNPDPAKEVPFGLDSWDEMFSGYLSFYAAD